jgi:hypothetical protein
MVFRWQLWSAIPLKNSMQGAKRRPGYAPNPQKNVEDVEGSHEESWIATPFLFLAF